MNYTKKGLDSFAKNFAESIKELHSLSNADSDELQKDIKDTFVKSYNDWHEKGAREGIVLHVCNVSLGNRYFKSVMSFNFHESFLSLLSFDEVTIDEFLDNINENKKLLDIGFEKI